MHDAKVCTAKMSKEKESKSQPPPPLCHFCKGLACKKGEINLMMNFNEHLRIG